MPVVTFEQETEALSEKDLAQLETMKVILPKIMKPNTLFKAPELCAKINFELAGYYNVTPVSLRKWTNYMRTNTILPVIATSRGYFLSYDRQTILDQIQSLRERASSINKAGDGLLKFIE